MGFIAPLLHCDDNKVLSHYRWWIAFKIILVGVLVLCVLLVDYPLHRWFFGMIDPFSWWVWGVFYTGFGMFWLLLGIAVWLMLWLVRCLLRLVGDEHTNDIHADKQQQHIYALTFQHSIRALYDKAHALQQIASWVLTCYGSTLVVIFILKATVGRPRPWMWDSLGMVWPVGWAPDHYAFASFPSGHAATYAMVITLVALHTLKWRTLLLVVMVSFSMVRIIQGGHYLSDVLAGLVIGSVMPFCVTSLLAERGKWVCWKHWDPESPWRCSFAFIKNPMQSTPTQSIPE